MKTHPVLGIALVIAAASLWGTTGTAQSFGSGQLPAPWFGARRLAVASLFFAAYVLLLRPAAPAGSAGRLSRLDVVGAGLCMAVYNLAFFAGIRDTGVAVGTAIALGSWRSSSACRTPAHSGPLPSAIAVPTATPVSRMPAKKARL